MIFFNKLFPYLSLLFVLSETSAQVKFPALSVENNGRSAILNKVLYSDPLGFLWYGTSNGVVFESGTYRTLFQYDHPSGIEVKYTYSLFRTPKDKLYVCTDMGLWRLDIKTKETKWVITDESLFDTIHMYSFVEGSQGDFWAGDFDGGIYHVNTDESYSKVYTGDFGRVELSYFHEGLGLIFKASNAWYQLNGKQLQLLFSSNAQNSMITNNGNLFPKNQSGTYTFLGKKYGFHYNEQLNVQFVDLPFSEIIPCFGMSHSQIFDQDILVVENNKLKHYEIAEIKNRELKMVLSNSFSYPSIILDAVVPSLGRAYVQTQNGIYFEQYEKFPFEQMLNKPQDFGEVDTISCRGMVEDGQGNIYIYTYFGMFVLPKGANEFKVLPLNKPSDFDWDASGIFSIELLDDNTLIAYGTKNYFYLIDLKQKTLQRQTIKYNEVQNNLTYMDVERINDSIVWGLSSFGIKEINYKTWESKELNHPLQEFINFPNQSGFLLKRNRAGQKIWIGTYNQGLYEWDRKTDQVTHYSEHFPENTLVGDEIRALYEDQKGDLWVGTTTGLQRISYSGGTSTVYSVESGLFNANITGILEAENAIWVGTYFGLAQVNLKADLIENYFESDGLTHNEFNVKSAFKSIDNKMYFGGINGVIRFDPKNFMDFSPAPELFLLGYEKFDPDEGKNISFNTFDKQGFQINLSSDQNYITLIFALNDIFNYQYQFISI